MMLMMPALPSALYFELGLSITSMRSMLSAGICCSISPRLSLVSPLALPLIHTSTLVLPRSDTSPSVDTSTEGMLSSRSLADPPAAAIIWSVVNVLRSTSSFICERWPVTFTSFSAWLSSARCTAGSEACFLAADRANWRVRLL